MQKKNLFKCEQMYATKPIKLTNIFLYLYAEIFLQKWMSSFTNGPVFSTKTTYRLVDFHGRYNCRHALPTCFKL